MKFRFAVSTGLLAVFLGTLLAGAIMPAKADRDDYRFNNGYYRNHHIYRYHRNPVIIEQQPVWTAPQPGWRWYSHDWYYNHPYAWRHAHPYHTGPRGGFYLQF